jgi:hypothetical protein
LGGIGERERREEILENPGKFQLLYKGKEEYCRGMKSGATREGRLAQEGENWNKRRLSEERNNKELEYGRKKKWGRGVGPGRKGKLEQDWERVEQEWKGKLEEEGYRMEQEGKGNWKKRGIGWSKNEKEIWKRGG